MNKFWKQSVVAAAAIAGFAGAAQAGPVNVDGKVNASEYDYKWTVAGVNAGDGQNTLSSGVPGDATIYMSQGANGHLYIGLVLPKSYVDNSYGTSSIGWGTHDHTFKELLGSDRIVGLSFLVNKTSQVNLDVDYMAQLGSTGATYGSSGIASKGSARDSDSGALTVYDQGNGKVNSGGPVEYFKSRSSMDYNFALPGSGAYFGVGADSPTAAGSGNSTSSADSQYAGSSFSGWLFDVMYEVEIYDTPWMSGKTFDFAKGMLGSDTFSLGFDLHASPNKWGEFASTITGGGTPTGGGGTTVVPLPSSVWMGGLMLAGILGRRHLKRRKAAQLS